ncbi:protein phyllopod isoform X2 [Drosophila montana]|uniref:protein phyllopod isoform X2 n=1 Tax=Drosophila montana TaxID=40370 RepID=UPI00313A8558
MAQIFKALIKFSCCVSVKYAVKVLNLLCLLKCVSYLRVSTIRYQYLNKKCTAFHLNVEKIYFLNIFSQPLNEDKFLCFSCNNWLINWHSLQALNSNDAESQSRSQSPSHMGNHSSAGLVQQQQKGLPLERAKLRPVAQVRPQPQAQMLAQPQVQLPAAQIAPPPAISYNKRRFGRRTAAASSGRGKMLRHSSSCACRKCRDCENCKWRTLHRRSLVKVAQLQRALCRQQQPKQSKRTEPQLQQEQRLVKTPATPTGQPKYQRMPAPRVDGKVVAMFRRLGTTLSTEQESHLASLQEPLPTARPPLRIMSPAKQRPRWTRALDEDEILLEFDSGIFEVLREAPSATTARRRLRYQLSSETQAAEVHAAAETEVQKELENRKVTHQNELKLAGLQLPQGLSITLI